MQHDEKIHSFFNSADGDFIIRSADGTEFRILGGILAEASPVFRAMMSLPQPSSLSSTSYYPDSVEVMDVTESTETLETLLRLIYPVEEPAFRELQELNPVLEAAVKYDMRKAIARFRDILVLPRFLISEPVRIYAIACRYGFSAEARIASRHTLRHNLAAIDDIEEFQLISALDYRRLQSLHRKRSKAAIGFLQPNFATQCTGKCYMDGGANNSSSRAGYTQWWQDYSRRATEELEQRPTSEVITTFNFIALSAKRASCLDCSKHIFSESRFFDKLKMRIDDLPDTI